MKIEIYKKDNDENIYFSYKETKDKILNFENLKIMSKKILEDKKNDLILDYQVEANSDLILYKTTVEDVIKSIITDDELFNLYKEKTEKN